MAETLRDYLPGESNKLEHAIGRTDKESKAAGCIICEFAILMIILPKELDILFNSLFTSLFMFGAEVWGCAVHSKYLLQMDRLLNRAFIYGYVLKRVSILDVIHDKDLSHWNRITSGRQNGLEELSPRKRERKLRQRGHDYMLPRIRTQRFKNSFTNRCLFKLV